MTTNKPEVVAWLRNERGENARGPATFDPMCVFGSPAPEGLGASYSPVVLLSDYEALQAECEKLRKAAEVSAADANDAERELEALRRDAELYRALRVMHWHNSPLAVVQNPKEAVKPGTYCPSGNQLDEILKEYLSETPNPGET